MTTKIWELKWFYFGDVMTLLTEGCPQQVGLTTRTKLNEKFDEAVDRRGLEKLYSKGENKWPMDKPLLLWMIKRITDGDRSDKKNYKWNYSSWRNLELWYRNDLDDEIIISKNKCILPATDVLKRYLKDFEGNKEILQDKSVRNPKTDLFVNTLFFAYEDILVKNLKFKCREFINGETAGRRKMLVDFGKNQKGSFDLPDDSRTKIYRLMRTSDQASIMYDSNNVYTFKFGGRIRFGSGKERKCEEKLNLKSSAAVSEYPCGGFEHP